MFVTPPPSLLAFLPTRGPGSGRARPLLVAAAILVAAELVIDLGPSAGGILTQIELTANLLAIAVITPGILACGLWPDRAEQPVASAWLVGAFCIGCVTAAPLISLALSGGPRGIDVAFTVPPELTLVLVKVVFEELVFRLLLLQLFSVDYQVLLVLTPAGVVLSALLFSAWHAPRTGPVAADHFLFAIVMSGLLLLTRTILWPVVFHALNNVVADAVQVSTSATEFGITTGPLVLKYLVWFGLLALLFECRRPPADTPFRTTARPIAGASSAGQ